MFIDCLCARSHADSSRICLRVHVPDVSAASESVMIKRPAEHWQVLWGPPWMGKGIRIVTCRAILFRVS